MNERPTQSDAAANASGARAISSVLPTSLDKKGSLHDTYLTEIRFSSMDPSQLILYLFLLLALLFKKVCAKTGDFSTLEIMSQHLILLQTKSAAFSSTEICQAKRR